jgi:hypothetical protein
LYDDGKVLTFEKGYKLFGFKPHAHSYNLSNDGFAYRYFREARQMFEDLEYDLMVSWTNLASVYWPYVSLATVGFRLYDATPSHECESEDLRVAAWDLSKQHLDMIRDKKLERSSNSSLRE